MNNNLLRDRILELSNPISPQPVDHKLKTQTLEDIRCVALDFYGTMFISNAGDIGIDEEQQQNSLYFTESLESTGFTIRNENTGQKGVDLFEEIIEANITAARNKGIDYPEPDVRSIWFDVLRKLIEEEFISGELTRESARYFGIEFEFRINKIWPVPGLAEFLQSLLNKDLILGIISNSQYYTPLAFEAFLGNRPEDFGFNPNLLVWSYETGRKKPSRHFYERFVNAAEEENIQPQEILYIGNDIRKDIQPAKELGLKTALFVGDTRSIRHTHDEIEQEKYQANLIIDNLHQVLDCLSL